MEILSLIFKFSHSIEVSERILSCMAAARIIPENLQLFSIMYQFCAHRIKSKDCPTIHVHGWVTVTLNHVTLAMVTVHSAVDGCVRFVHWSPRWQRVVIESLAFHWSTHGAVWRVDTRWCSVRGSTRGKSTYCTVWINGIYLEWNNTYFQNLHLVWSFELYNLIQQLRESNKNYKHTCTHDIINMYALSLYNIAQWGLTNH